jgi:arginine utilization protein RocB
MASNEKAVSFSPDDRYLAVLHCPDESNDEELAVEIYEVNGFMLKVEEYENRNMTFFNSLSPVCFLEDGTSEEIDESSNFCGLIRKDRDPYMGISRLQIGVQNKQKKIKIIYSNFSRS